MATTQTVYAGAPAPEAAVAVSAAGTSQLAAGTPVIDLLSVPLTEDRDRLRPDFPYEYRDDFRQRR